MSNDLEFSVGEFVAYANQTLEYAYPNVVIVGELANYKVSKNRWVYFDLKDSEASVRFFGTVYNITHALENGMLLKVRGMPRLHPQFGFSITIQAVELVGEGTINRARQLLEKKLTSEGLFDATRKRALPYPPRRIGLITSVESAAYADFTKIISERWGGMELLVCDVQVQGVGAAKQIIAAIDMFNTSYGELDALVMIRGGGSADDLQVFSDESVVRAVAASRTPTLVAIGHESDMSLAEMAADVRASTPSNAAELLTPDRVQVMRGINLQKQALTHALDNLVRMYKQQLDRQLGVLHERTISRVKEAKHELQFSRGLLEAYDPTLVLQRGYALVRKQQYIAKGSTLSVGDIVEVEMSDARIVADITEVHNKEK